MADSHSLISRIVDLGPRAVLLSASLTSSLPRVRRHVEAIRGTSTPVAEAWVSIAIGVILLLMVPTTLPRFVRLPGDGAGELCRVAAVQEHVGAGGGLHRLEPLGPQAPGQRVPAGFGVVDDEDAVGAALAHG